MLQHSQACLLFFLYFSVRFLPSYYFCIFCGILAVQLVIFILLEFLNLVYNYDTKGIHLLF